MSNQRRWQLILRNCVTWFQKLSLKRGLRAGTLFLIGGDFNRRDISDAVGDFEDIVEIVHGPTRGREKLDRTFTNIEDTNSDTRVLPPLETEAGTQSDHNCIITQFKWEIPRTIVWQKTKVRKKTREGDDKFEFLLSHTNWTDLYLGAADVSEMVDLLHTKFGDWMNEC